MTETHVVLSRPRSADDYRSILESNAEEFEHMARMISDTLLLAKAENGLAAQNLETLNLADAVSICMENTGDGIAQEYWERVFDRFFRVDPSRQRSSEGTGLDLAIAKSIVIAHGGTISVSSADNVTAFTIRLPRASWLFFEGLVVCSGRPAPFFENCCTVR